MAATRALAVASGLVGCPKRRVGGAERGSSQGGMRCSAQRTIPPPPPPWYSTVTVAPRANIQTVAQPRGDAIGLADVDDCATSYMGRMLSNSVSGSRPRRRALQWGSGRWRDTEGVLSGPSRPPSSTRADTCRPTEPFRGRDEQLNISGQLDQFITFLFLVVAGISGNFSPGVCAAVCRREAPLLTHALMTLLGEAVIHTVEMLLGNTNLTVPSPCLSEAVPVIGEEALQPAEVSRPVGCRCLGYPRQTQSATGGPQHTFQWRANVIKATGRQRLGATSADSPHLNSVTRSSLAT
ncbi:hypothetical protein D4764_09G0007610 [Takifugu flavidus]|uniref:Uncharacterized protein n=1 Tax=Takifugu flavidus TaxID=433684 RepID=A0A5C6MNF7_9TELE|nr:hypothetical protein D4764_09G0007610 [Takifugu flavidus]